MPSSELLTLLDKSIHEGITAAATDALARLSSERIYGFILTHYIFSSCRVSVLTEIQLEKSLRKREAKHPDFPVDSTVRWSPIESEYYMYREDLFSPHDESFYALDGRELELEVARIFIRAMRYVRENIITDPQIVLSVMDYTEGPSISFYAYAELFNDAPTLARLKDDLRLDPHWDFLDLERSRIPRD